MREINGSKRIGRNKYKGVKEKWREQKRGTKNSGGSRIGGPRIVEGAEKGDQE